MLLQMVLLHGVAFAKSDDAVSCLLEQSLVPLKLTIPHLCCVNLSLLASHAEVISALCVTTDDAGLATIGSLTYLEELWVTVEYGTRLSDVSPLGSLQCLKTLNLSCTGADNTAVGSVAHLAGLQELVLDNSPLSDISALRGHPSLRVIGLNARRSSASLRRCHLRRCKPSSCFTSRVRRVSLVVLARAGCSVGAQPPF
jgi:Leucine-rich repeat (LRR) protein